MKKKIIGLLIGLLAIASISTIIIFNKNSNTAEAMANNVETTEISTKTTEPMEETSTESVVEPTEEEITDSTEEPTAEESTNPIEEPTEATTETSIIITEELDKTMYGIKNGNIRSGDSTDYDKIASLEYGATIKVTGKTANGWYRIQWGNIEAYCASSLLADTKPSATSTNKPTAPAESKPNAGGTVTPPSQPETPQQPSNPAPEGGTDPATGLPINNSGWNTSDIL